MMSAERLDGCDGATAVVADPSAKHHQRMDPCDRGGQQSDTPGVGEAESSSQSVHEPAGETEEAATETQRRGVKRNFCEMNQIARSLGSELVPDSEDMKYTRKLRRPSSICEVSTGSQAVLMVASSSPGVSEPAVILDTSSQSENNLLTESPSSGTNSENTCQVVEMKCNVLMSDVKVTNDVNKTSCSESSVSDRSSSLELKIASSVTTTAAATDATNSSCDDSRGSDNSIVITNDSNNNSRTVLTNNNSNSAGRRQSPLGSSRKVYGLRPRSALRRLWSETSAASCAQSATLDTTSPAPADSSTDVSLTMTAADTDDSNSSSTTTAMTRTRSNSSSKSRVARSKPLSKYRRITANARERDRMKEINTAFETLRAVLPTFTTCRLSSMTKHTTLQLAASYIRGLSDLLSEAPSSDHENKKENRPSYCHGMINSGNRRDVNLSVGISEIPYDRAQEAASSDKQADFSMFSNTINSVSGMSNDQLDELGDMENISDVCWALDFMLE